VAREKYLYTAPGINHIGERHARTSAAKAVKDLFILKRSFGSRRPTVKERADERDSTKSAPRRKTIAREGKIGENRELSSIQGVSNNGDTFRS